MCGYHKPQTKKIFKKLTVTANRFFIFFGVTAGPLIVKSGNGFLQHFAILRFLIWTVVEAFNFWSMNVLAIKIKQRT